MLCGFFLVSLTLAEHSACWTNRNGEHEGSVGQPAQVGGLCIPRDHFEGYQRAGRCIDRHLLLVKDVRQPN